MLTQNIFFFKCNFSKVRLSDPTRFRALAKKKSRVRNKNFFKGVFLSKNRTLNSSFALFLGPFHVRCNWILCCDTRKCTLLVWIRTAICSSPTALRELVAACFRGNLSKACKEWSLFFSFSVATLIWGRGWISCNNNKKVGKNVLLRVFVWLAMHL